MCCRALWGLLFCLIGIPAIASTAPLRLDFDAALYSGGSTLALDGATIENIDGGDLFIYRTGDFEMPAPGGFCALDASSACKANVKITFDDPVTDLRFSSFYVAGGDAAILRAVVGDAVVRQFFVTSETLVDLGDVGGITELSLFDLSGLSDKGIAFGGFSYAIYTPIPLPSGAPLLFTALCLLGFGRSRLTARSRA